MWSTFTTTVDIYAGANGIGVGCSGNASNPVAVSETLASPLCLRVAASLWAKLPALCSDDDRVGQPLDWFPDGNCTGTPLELNPSASYHGGFGFCSRAALPAGARSYVVRCRSAPSGATAAWVATLAALIALSALGLILFWLWRDREAARAAAREAARLAASIDAEKGKAARIASAKGGGGKTSPSKSASYGAIIARASYSSLDIEVGGGSGGNSPERERRR